MKKIQGNYDITLDVVCPYCNNKQQLNLDDFDEYEYEDKSNSVHIVESLLRGIARSYFIGEDEIGDVVVSCKKCPKDFIVENIYRND